MKISRIKIENFRSIQSAEFTATDFNIFVGQNNSGKTNYFETMEFFFNGLKKDIKINDVKFQREEGNHILVEVEFSGAQNGMGAMQNEANRTKIERALAGSDTVVFTRTSHIPNRRTMFVGGEEVRPGTGFDQALNDFLPKFEYVSTKQYYDSVAKYAKTTPIGIMLSGVLNTILQENVQYQEFQQKFRELFEDDDSQIKEQFDIIGGRVRYFLEKQFPDCTSVKFEVTPPAFEDLLKNFDTSVDDGVETLAEEKGDGMQRALMLAIIQAFAEYRRAHDELGRTFLFFIDEAELHLHPTAQRKLKDVLYTLSQETDQVFINTHSSVFIADNYNGQSLFKVEKNEGQTSIVFTTDADKPYIIYELLGGSPSDLLLPKNFLVVEGKSEIEFLNRLINRIYPERPKIHIIQSMGDIDQAERTINAIERVYTALQSSIYRDTLIILIDHPSDERRPGVDAFLGRNNNLRVNNQFHQLPLRDIEQCYPDQEDPVYRNWRRTQEETDAMTSHQKLQLARRVGDGITQEQFEAMMPECFTALTECWAKAY